jgi:hypothetical protein
MKKQIECTTMERRLAANRLSRAAKGCPQQTQTDTTGKEADNAAPAKNAPQKTPVAAFKVAPA